MAEKIKRFYDLGLWNKDMMRKAVEKGLITSDDYKEITGEEY